MIVLFPQQRSREATADSIEHHPIIDMFTEKKIKFPSKSFVKFSERQMEAANIRTFGFFPALEQRFQ